MRPDGMNPSVLLMIGFVEKKQTYQHDEGREELMR